MRTPEARPDGQELYEQLRGSAPAFELALALGTDARRALEAKRAGSPVPVPAWAPTLNEYNGLQPWQKAALRSAIDAAILAVRPQWPRWSAGFSARPKVKGGKLLVERIGGARRLIVVTRESSRRPDELATDVLGGKVPIDRLVIAGVLVGDSDRWLARLGQWTPAPTGQGRVLVRVYDLRP